MAAIDRYRYATAARIPFGDENEFAQFGFARVFYDPVNGQGVAGNILNFRVQEKPINKLLLYGQANLELYEPGAFKNRVTYDIGGIFEPIDLVRMYFNGFQQNVVESAGSLRQDIHRGGIRFGGDIRPTRRWDFGGNYLYADYSDHNSLAEFHLFNEVLLMYLPTQLKLVTQMDYDSFAHASVLNPLDPTNSTFAVHPYFSPRGFSFYENRLEWTHYVSRDYFAHANVCYYSLQYGLGFDNNFKTYHRFALYSTTTSAPGLALAWIRTSLFPRSTKRSAHPLTSSYAGLISGSRAVASLKDRRLRILENRASDQSSENR